jgi:hypothetical protein
MARSSAGQSKHSFTHLLEIVDAAESSEREVLYRWAEAVASRP